MISFINAIQVKTQFIGKDLNAIVLPVPLTPAKRTLMPKPRCALRGKTPTVIHYWALANVRRNLPQDLFLGFGQNQIIPLAAGEMRCAKSSSRGRACTRHASHSCCARASALESALPIAVAAAA